MFEVAEVSHFRVIPDRPDTWSSQGDAFADARLIAAAPELLDALRQWANAEATNDAEELQNARGSRDAAIAKATGGQP